MCKKNDSKIKVSCVGMSAKCVTGSAYLVECPTGEKILLDCGMYQDSSKYECYKINKRGYKIDASDLTAIVISHSHLDHSCSLPLVYKDGAKCNTYMSYESVDIMKPMMLDCVKISERDAIGFDRKYKGSHEPLYDIEDVENCLPYIRGVETNRQIEISPNVSFELIPSGHIFGACQIVLYVKKPSGNIVKIAYSGDLGNIIFDQPFCKPFEKVVKANMYIGECTYNDKNRSIKKGQREKDIEVMKNVIEQTCIEQHGQVLIPSFSLHRVEVMLHTLYNLYKDDETFNIPIVVDSPLAVNLLDCYMNNLDKEDAELLSKILSWKNVKIIRTVEESQLCVADTKPKIILS